MSFTLLTEPIKIQPVFNDLTFRVSETNYTQTNFRYNFYTYLEGVLVNTSKLYPRPDGTCHFNPNHILQQYLSSYFNSTLTSYSEANTSEIKSYQIVFKYEYETAGVMTEYLALTSSTHLTYKAVASYEDAQAISTYVGEFLPAASSNCEFLNITWRGNNERDGNILYSKDKRYISFFRKDLTGSAIPYSISFFVKCLDGTQKQFDKTLTTATTSSIGYINHFPIGLTELNNITWSGTAIPSGKSSQITLAEDYGMSIRLYNIDGDAVSKPIYFTFQDSDAWCQYEHYIVAYSNVNGSFGFLNCDAKHMKNISIEKEIYNKIKPYNYTNTSREVTVYSNIGQGKITLNTTWMIYDEQIEEYINMLLSDELYLIDKSNNIIPVYISKVESDIPLIKQDHATYFTFTLNEAFIKNTMK